MLFARKTVQVGGRRGQGPIAGMIYRRQWMDDGSLVSRLVRRTPRVCWSAGSITSLRMPASGTYHQLLSQVVSTPLDTFNVGDIGVGDDSCVLAKRCQAAYCARREGHDTRWR